MASRPIRKLLLFVLLLLLAAAVVTGFQTQRDIVHHHSLEPPYIHDWWHEGIPHWDIGGDTVVTDEYIRLTPAKPSRFGWIWNHQLNDNPSWEVTAKIRIRSKSNPGADGLALWYVDEPYKHAKSGPVMGMGTLFKGIGVIFDSYDNDGLKDNPFVGLIINLDGLIKSWNVDFHSQTRFRCVFDFRSLAAKEALIVIWTYVDRKLSLRLRWESKPQLTVCGEALNVDIPVGWYFGMTATTGHLVDNHDVVSFQLRPLGQSVGNPQIPLEHFDHAKDDEEKTYWKSAESPAGAP